MTNTAKDRTFCRLIALLTFFLFCAVSPAFSAGISPEALRDALDASLKVEGSPLGDAELIDQDGARFRLSDYSGKGRALVISFVYTKCPDVCPGITAEFIKAVEDARFKYRDKVDALTISFDPAFDTPARMKAYGLRFARDFKAERFATGDPATIKRLVEKTGFFYVKRDDGGFDHIDMATVLRPDGTIYRQVYGLRTTGALLTDRIGEVVAGKPVVSGSSLIDRIKFFCYRYDPYTNRYVIDYAVLAGLVIQSVVIGAVIFAVWGARITGFFRRVSGKKTCQGNG